jgi:outer membrane protein TolC
VGASLGAAGLLADPLTQQWSIGPLISWTLPSSGTHARIHATEAGADAALAEFDHSVLQALRETQTALSRYAHDLQRLQSLQQAQAQAALAAGQNRRLYQGGRTPLPVQPGCGPHPGLGRCHAGTAAGAGVA